MLFSFQEILNVFYKLKDNEIECIWPIMVISALQMRVLVLACLQIAKMMLFALKQVFCRANIPLLIDTVDNGIDARNSGKVG